MYATVTQVKNNEARLQESGEQADRVFGPKLRRAPGFVTMYMIAEQDGSLVVTIWESKAQADAFGKEQEAWNQTVTEHGHQLLRYDGGEVVRHVTPQQ